MALNFAVANASLFINKDLVLAPPWAFGGWIKPSSLPASVRVLFQTDDGSETNRYRVAIDANQKIILQATDSTGSATAVTTTAIPSTAAYHHVLAVCAATNDMRVYIDGGSKGTTATVRIPQDLAECLLGLSTSNTGDYAGLLDYLSVWSGVILVDADAVSLFGGANPFSIQPAFLKGIIDTRDPANLGRDLLGLNNFTVSGPTYSATNAVVAAPSTAVTGVGATNHVKPGDAGVAVTGFTFGAQGAGSKVEIVDGALLTAQTVTAWIDTQATIDVIQGTARYGGRKMRVTSNAGGVGDKDFTLDPVATKSFVNLASVAAFTVRVSSTPDLSLNDQIEISNVVGGTIADVAMNTDGTFSVLASVASFDFRVHDQTTGWGASATVLINPVIEIDVPPVVGLTLAAGTAAIVGAGLVVGAVTYAPSLTVPVGLIMLQNPEGGQSVLVGASVNLVVSSGFITVPDIGGDTAARANAEIQAAGLSVGEAGTAVSDTVKYGNVVSQFPLAGAHALPGDSVSYLVSILQPTFNVDRTVISQYQNSPTLLRLVHNMSEYIDRRTDFAAFYQFVWNVDTAVGFGLNIWGRIVGVSRLLQIPGGDSIVGFDNADVPYDWTPMSEGRFAREGEATTTYELPDDAYRVLILTKALANIATTTGPALNQLLRNMFPGRGRAFVRDLGGMAMRFVFNFQLTPVEYAILTQSGVLPHPAGVFYSVEVVVGGLFGFAGDSTALPFNFGIFNSRP